jgi:hypothetical protein
MFYSPYEIEASTSDKRMPITTPSYKYLVLMLLQTCLLSRWSLPLRNDQYNRKARTELVVCTGAKVRVYK